MRFLRFSNLKSLSLMINEVIVYRVMMYANPSLIVQAMYFTSKGQSALLGGDF